jgi:hypothetical protein
MDAAAQSVADLEGLPLRTGEWADGHQQVIRMQEDALPFGEILP